MTNLNKQTQKSKVRIEKITEGLKCLENKNFDRITDTEKFYEVFYKTLKRDVTDITHNEIEATIQAFSTY